MKTRILTGVVGIPIVLLCIFGPTPLIYLLGFVMMAALNYELANMQGEALQRSFLIFCFVNMLVAFAVYTFVTKELGFIFAIVNVLVMAETVFTYPRTGLSEMMYLAFINAYCTWLPLHMISSGLPGDPLGAAGPGGDLSVQRHGVLHLAAIAGRRRMAFDERFHHGLGL